MKFTSNGKYENRQSCEWCGISNGRIISKFSNFWNFDNIKEINENSNFKNF